MKLTGKQERFCQEYVKDFNGYRSAVAAGYSERSAKNTACENMTKQYLVERINDIKASREIEVKVDAAWVLKKSIALHDLCIEAGQYSTAAKALDTVGKHVNVQAFSEKQVIEHTGNISHDTTAMGNDILSALFERRRDDQERSKQIH